MARGIDDCILFPIKKRPNTLPQICLSPSCVLTTTRWIFLPGSISSSEVFRDRCANGEVPCCRAPERTNSVILLWKIQLIFQKVGGPLARSCMSRG